MSPIQISKRLDEIIYINLSVNYNSEGRVMTRKELKPRINMIKNLILNFTIESLQQKNVSYIEFQEAKNLTI
jgi:hypothetical protein